MAERLEITGGPLRFWFRAQYNPVNAAKLTNIVSKEFTNVVNLWHFFVPQEELPRSMTGNMLRFDCDDNPEIAFF